MTGGIAAYKVPLLARLFIKQGDTVRVAMTAAAEQFVTADTLAILTKATVLTDANSFEHPEHVAHVELARWTDIAIVVPASANTIAKLAMGLADNVVTTTLLATTAPKMIVPAMNDHMWANPQTQANLAHLIDQGVQVLSPATGFLAEGYAAPGRMPEPEIIQLWVNAQADLTGLTGKRVLVSAGGTRERLDPVRYLTNDSSGKMGAAVANVAAAAGAEVTLVTTKAVPVLPNVQVVSVESAQELAQAMLAQPADIVVMAAAVADFRPVTTATNKIKKTADNDEFHLDLVKNPDILSALGHQKRPGQKVIGFAAETTDLIHNASVKLAEKGADMIVANQVGVPDSGFNVDVNQVTLLRPEQPPLPLPKNDKLTIAKQILEIILQDN
ncbi:phosphopantothenoylcysteinesynthetase decarboxyla se [Lacticaseibacillus brantae DSM 23927]|uniref:Coenzyme A biosynthesis bifunctional protein CoaBC n=1 Tax=Lacticaseibacillus brantae DSM 23927 TaxID=1423727 RepID=A0A0R2B168_9LACO|nr:phosphopantothenoylcysteinesynthetase decarboxyla se [Lacticaseibacillus brantae DSM 23927]